ncbi:MAG: glgB, partial [candidate division NC10 bacterium]|nr:glgB [candidate division NC10 bacterium]
AATLSSAIVNDVVRGECGDPFAVLGPHALREGGRDGVAIRAFLPQATQASIVPADPAVPPQPMTSLHPAGLFEAKVFDRPEPFAYRLEIRDSGGATRRCDDPYRFPSTLSDFDLHLLGEGTHYRAYEKMGAHLATLDGVAGVRFAVWAPNARRVSVVGGWNGWDGRVHPMRLHPGNGIWELFVPGLGHDVLYKYEILSKTPGPVVLKSDPVAFSFELATPPTASVVTDLNYAWGDAEWMAGRAARSALDAPIAIYEVHLGSWMRLPEEGNRALTYRELGERLGAYTAEMGYTHVEFLPVTEHPFYGSWGYQPIGLYAPTRRYGTPQDFMACVDALHRRGVGVILDWVPAHFPNDPHGLTYFDGTHLYEHEDPRRREHPEWGTRIFNYGRNEVANYLIGSALFWLDAYHIDGLRLDAVASMLYLDYGRQGGDWLPNQYGGRENLEAVSFLRRLNEAVYREHPGAITIAEESTAWPQVSRPTYVGGLGFGFKWNMGWMHDLLDYMAKDPIYRKHHHSDLTFGLLYAWSENFILPLSHDEVVYGKGSLHRKMPGDDWQKFANLRAFYAFMYGHPGKKLLFMGGEFGQTNEWNHETSLDWNLLDMGPYHRGLQRLVQDLNRLYRAEAALHQVDYSPAGFQWIDCNDWDSSVISFLRRARDPQDFAVFVSNFTPVVRRGYRVGVPRGGFYREQINTDAAIYGGGNVGNSGNVLAEAIPAHGHAHSLVLTLPPLTTLVLRPNGASA